MPTASDELREKMNEYFQEPIELSPPLEFLKGLGWKDDAGMLRRPSGRNITQKEWDCVQFLIEEWDFGFGVLRTKRAEAH